MTTKEKTNEPAATYTKQQFLESKLFTPQQKDVLSALLEDGVEYTPEQVTDIVQKFARKVVQ